jgi:Protein of unknown function DUF262
MASRLEEQISAARIEISAESISMSISELTSLYKEGTLIIRPEFQRLYRWSEEQKSRLIESILLGIPLPSIFVAQIESGRWELVDGLQRVSSILELQGLLQGADGRIHPPLKLTKTRFLPELENHSWDGSAGTEPLSEAQQLDIRLARLDLKVIRRSSHPNTKFDLFQRLNSFGSQANPQEIRSALIAGTDAECLSWLVGLAKLEEFKRTVSVSERLVEEQYDLELILRFLMLHNRELSGGASALSDFSTRLDEWSLDLAGTFADRRQQLERVFVETFTSLGQRGSEDIFRKWDGNRFRGAFLNTSYEVIALGTGYHVARSTAHRTDYEEVARELWKLPEMETRFATGLATQDRLVRTIPLGRELTALPAGTVSGD